MKPELSIGFLANTFLSHYLVNPHRTPNSSAFHISQMTKQTEGKKKLSDLVKVVQSEKGSTAGLPTTVHCQVLPSSGPSLGRQQTQ